MEIKRCEQCGETLRKIGENWGCPYCGSIYTDNESRKLEELLEEKKCEALANRKRVLWDEAHKPYPSRDSLIKAAQSVREIFDEDDLACFYLAISDQDPGALNRYLGEKSVNRYTAQEILRFALLSLRPVQVLPLKEFVERHLKGDDYTKAMTSIEEIAGKLSDGLYMTNLPRKVFLAYSSKDMEEVVKMTEFLESNGMPVFCALRNLRHGVGSAEFYWSGICDAMAHCEAFVFLSSKNSRSLECEALSKEIPHLLDNLPNVKRIHYRLDDDGEISMAVKMWLNAFDDGREWCRSKEDLIARLIFKQKPVQKEEAQSVRPGFTLLEPDSIDVRSDRGKLIAYEGNAKRIVLSNAFRSIGSYAFKGRSTLVELDIGDGVEALDDYAFSSAERLETVRLGSHLTQIGPTSFAGTPALKEIRCDAEEFVNEDGFLLSQDRHTLYRYANFAAPRSIALPSSIYFIAAGAFAYTLNVNSIVLPEYLSTIGNGAFAKCGNLTSITIPHGVEKIGKNVFAGCPFVAITVRESGSRPGWDATWASGARVYYRP